MIFIVPLAIYETLRAQAAEARVTVNELCRQRSIGTAWMPEDMRPAASAANGFTETTEGT